MEPSSETEVREIRREFPALGRLAHFTRNGLGLLPRRSVEALTRRLAVLDESV